MVAEAFGLTTAELLSVRCPGNPTRNKPKHLAMWLSRRILGISWPRLGIMFGRHPSVVKSACQNVACYPEKYLKGSADVRLRRLVLQIYEQEGAATAREAMAAPGPNHHSVWGKYGDDQPTI
jgi:hypothetical protein